MHVTGEPHFHSTEVLMVLVCIAIMAGITWTVLDRG